jgi:hypothetical protein
MAIAITIAHAKRIVLFISPVFFIFNKDEHARVLSLREWTGEKYVGATFP